MLQGNSVEHETENEPAANSMEQNDEESHAENQGEEDAVRQEKTVEGYVLDVEGNTITVDLENPEGRNYSEEGLDHGVNLILQMQKKKLFRHQVIQKTGNAELKQE